jgi:hypothetical protein
MSIASVLDYSSLALIVSGERCSAFLLLRKHRYRLLPVFTIYIWYLLLTTVGLRVQEAVGSVNGNVYWIAFVCQEVMQRIIEFALIWELASRLMGSLKGRRGLAVTVMVGLGCLICVCCGIILGQLVRFDRIEASTQQFLHLDFAAGVLESLLFLFMIIGARVLRVQWQNPALLISLCLMLYSLSWVWTRIFQEIGKAFGCECNAFTEADQIVAILWAIAIWGLSLIVWKTDSDALMSQSQALSVTSAAPLVG